MPKKTKNISGGKSLAELLSGVDCRIPANAKKLIVTGISTDSRRIRNGDLFIALQGNTVDGHQYVDLAFAKGCIAVLAEKSPTAAKHAKSGQNVIVMVKDSKTALGQVAANFYDRPANRLKLIAITGTNGKTTTSYLAESMLKLDKARVGVIGTVNYRYDKANGDGIELPAPFTTPEAPALHRLFKEMADEGITHVLMEVSSHALAQKRLAGIFFDVAVFTNLSRDHLDFHGDMEHYFRSKCLLFTEHLKPEGRSVIVLEPINDRPAGPAREQAEPNWGRKLFAEMKQKNSADSSRRQGSKNRRSEQITTCGQDQGCDIYPLRSSFDLGGISAEISTPQGKLQLKSKLIGGFNLKNILTAVGIDLALGQNIENIGKGMERVSGVPGRLERVRSKKGTAVFVDYAHTPDALENVLSTLRSLEPERLICVFGCGGDRDKGKRPLMGKLAGMLSDIVLATSDNPRSEAPENILAEIESGLAESPLKRMRAELLFNNRWQGYDIIISRRQAIRTAISLSLPGDVILVAGKGHETYQIVGNIKKFFDDRLEAAMQDAVINW